MVTLDAIIDASAAHAGLTRSELICRDNRAEISRPRQRAMYLARRLRGDVSSCELGRVFQREPVVIRHGADRTAALVKTDAAELQAVETLRAVLQGREPDTRLADLDVREAALRDELDEIAAERRAIIARLRVLY